MHRAALQINRDPDVLYFRGGEEPAGSEAADGEGAAESQPGRSEMATLVYAGIGARATPEAVLADMAVMAGWLARTGWALSTGGADGADTAFAGGAPGGRKTIWLPWRGYNGHRGPDCRVLSTADMEACLGVAAGLHPAWDRCSPAVRKLHARNAAVLGLTQDRPVDAVIAWSAEGRVEGGTGMTIRIAEARGIPVLNLGSMSSRRVCKRMLEIRRSVTGS